MLGKLFKYDMRILSRTLLPLFLGIGAISLMSSLTLSLNVKYLSSNADSLFQAGNVLRNILQVFTVIFTTAGIIAICAGMLVTLFLIIRHFYSSLMGSEGYLTFTLPVTPGKILLSRMFTGYIWIVLSFLLTLLCAFWLALVGSAPVGSFFNPDIFKGIGDFFGLIGPYWTSNYTVLLIEFILVLLIAPLEQLLQIYLSIVIGSMLSKKNKVLASIGIYFAIGIVVRILTSIVTAVFAYSITYNNAMYVSAQEAFGVFSPVLIISIVFLSVLSVAFYFVSRYLLTNKLNME